MNHDVQIVVRVWDLSGHVDVDVETVFVSCGLVWMEHEGLGTLGQKSGVPGAIPRFHGFGFLYQRCKILFHCNSGTYLEASSSDWGLGERNAFESGKDAAFMGRFVVPLNCTKGCQYHRFLAINI